MIEECGSGIQSPGLNRFTFGREGRFLECLTPTRRSGVGVSLSSVFGGASEVCDPLAFCDVSIYLVTRCLTRFAESEYGPASTIPADNHYLVCYNATYFGSASGLLERLKITSLATVQHIGTYPAVLTAANTVTTLSHITR